MGLYKLPQAWRNADQTTELEWLFESLMPEHVSVMPVKGEPSYWRPWVWVKENDTAWVQLHLNDRHFFMIDFDGYGWDKWKTLPLEPNIICYNPINGNHQVFYWLEDPVHCHEAAQCRKPYLWLRNMEKAADEQYGGDKFFARRISKNPLSSKWVTEFRHDRRYTLLELHEGLELDLRKQRYREANAEKKMKKLAWAGAEMPTPLAYQEEGGGLSRNRGLFDRVRYRAYAMCIPYRISGDESGWYDTVLSMCNDFNHYTTREPLERDEVARIARHITDYTFSKKFDPSKYKKKDVMTKSEIKAAQSKAAKMTTAKIVGKNEAAIKEAIRQLKEDGKKPSKAAVARLAGLSRVAVSLNYSHLFD